MSRRRALMAVVAVGVAAVLLVAWLATVTNRYGVPLGPGEVALPTVSEQIDLCAGVGLETVLHGDQRGPRLAWLIDTLGGGRLDVIWPRSYRARFTPSLVVLDENDQPVLAEGDAVMGECGEVDGYAYIVPAYAR